MLFSGSSEVMADGFVAIDLRRGAVRDLPLFDSDDIGWLQTSSVGK
ncbi:hypothetical protein [Vibrio penaeicida]|nr:hypothetical protein [Vibrio penaeicida]